MEKIKGYYRYNLKGFGAFPVDMLRYDQCWPFREIDLAMMCRGSGVREVRVMGLNVPTLARWRSFG